MRREDYYPFGSQFNSYTRENSVENKYLYNGKELQDELDLGWLDYGQRMYQPELGRFFSPDRFAAKYPDFSPYSYASNNPALIVDINGDSTWVTSSAPMVDKEGNTTINQTVNITGKVLKDGKGQMTAGQLASGLNQKLNAQTGQIVSKDANGHTVTINVSVNAEFTGAQSMDDVSKSDHLLVIVDAVEGNAEPTLGGGPAVGLAGTPGKVGYIEGGSDDMVGTAFHETGHMLGLGDAKVNNVNDPMSYTGRGANFTNAQMSTIWNRADQYSGRNYGIMKDYFPNVPRGAYNTSTNTRPFQVAPDQRAKIPLPLTNPNP